MTNFFILLESAFSRLKEGFYHLVGRGTYLLAARPIYSSHPIEDSYQGSDPFAHSVELYRADIGKKKYTPGVQEYMCPGF